MNLKEKLYNWVENKIGDEIDKTIDDSFDNNTELNVGKYAKQLVKTVFSDKEIKQFQEKVLTEKDWESDFSIVDGDDDVIHGIDLTALTIDGDLSSDTEKSCRELLRSFEYESVEEILSFKTWKKTRKSLIDLLIVKNGNGKPALLSLKVARYK